MARHAPAVVERADDDRDIAIGLEADAAHLTAWRAGQFEIVADAAPAPPLKGAAQRTDVRATASDRHRALEKPGHALTGAIAAMVRLAHTTE